MAKIHKISQGSNLYFVENKGRLILIDTGNGQISRLNKACRELDFQLPDIELIILTHAHSDHAKNLQKLKGISNAKIIAHTAAQKNLKRGTASFPAGTSMFTRLISWLMNKFLAQSGKFPATAADILVKDTYSLKNWGIDGSIHAVPGHTQDSIIVLIDKKHCFVGDTMFNIWPWSVYPLFANDQNQLVESWRYIKKLPEIERFYPGHGQPFSRDKFLRSYNRIE